MMKHALIALVCLVMFACKKDAKPEDKKADDKSPSTEPAKPADKPADKPSEPAASTVDHADPAKVLEHVFAAAAAGKADGLSGLCDPGGSGDGDVKDVCGSKPGSPKWDEFVSYFAKGKVNGAPRVEGDGAEIDFLFGPDGTKKETMKLKKIDGKWYLAGF